MGSLSDIKFYGCYADEYADMKRDFSQIKGDAFSLYSDMKVNIDIPKWLLSSRVLREFLRLPAYNILLEGSMYPGSQDDVQGLMCHIDAMPEHIGKVSAKLAKFARSAAKRYNDENVYGKEVVNAECILYLYRKGNTYVIKVSAGDAQISLSFAAKDLYENKMETWKTLVGKLVQNYLAYKEGRMSKGDYYDIYTSTAWSKSTLRKPIVGTANMWGHEVVFPDYDVAELLSEVCLAYKDAVRDLNTGMFVVGTSERLTIGANLIRGNYHGVGLCPDYTEGFTNLAKGYKMHEYEKSVLYFKYM